MENVPNPRNDNDLIFSAELMSSGDFRGLNEKGEIINSSSQKNIPEPYRAVVDDAIQSALKEFPGQIHSMYIYGSVGEGSATPYKSDLDLSAIVYEEPTDELEDRFAAVAKEVCARHPIITKLDYDVGGLQEVISPEQRNGWHYWVAQCSANVFGEDLSKEMGPLSPSLELAYGINKDIETRVNGALKNLNEDTVDGKSKGIAKKLLRTAYSLIAAEDKTWFTKVNLCADAFLKYHPEHEKQVAQSLQIASEGTDVESLKAYLADFGQSVIRLFREKTHDLASSTVQYLTAQ